MRDKEEGRPTKAALSYFIIKRTGRLGLTAASSLTRAR